jgi:hypothetical protein
MFRLNQIDSLLFEAEQMETLEDEFPSSPETHRATKLILKNKAEQAIIQYEGEEIWSVVNNLIFNENTQFEGTKISCLELIYTIISMMGVRAYYKEIIIHDLKVSPASGGVNAFMQEMLEGVG